MNEKPNVPHAENHYAARCADGRCFHWIDYTREAAKATAAKNDPVCGPHDVVTRLATTTYTEWVLCR